MVEILLASFEAEIMDYFQWCERVLSTYLEAARSSLQVARIPALPWRLKFVEGLAAKGTSAFMSRRL